MSTLQIERFVSRTRWRVESMESKGILSWLALLLCAGAVFFVSFEAGGLLEGNVGGPPTGQLQPLHGQAAAQVSHVPTQLMPVPALSSSLASEPRPSRGGSGNGSAKAGSEGSGSPSASSTERLASVAPSAAPVTPAAPVSAPAAPVSAPSSPPASASPAPAGESSSGGGHGSFDSSG